MIRVTVTPQTHSGFRFNELACSTQVEYSAALGAVVGEITAQAVQVMHSRAGGDWQGYDYVVSFEET